MLRDVRCFNIIYETGVFYLFGLPVVPVNFIVQNNRLCYSTYLPETKMLFKDLFFNFGFRSLKDNVEENFSHVI